MPKKEKLILARGRWEFATVETNSVTGKPQWIRRDTSYICDVGQETEVQDMPARPKRPAADMRQVFADAAATHRFPGR